MKLIITCLIIILLNGCSNYLYKGNIKVADSKGIDREIILYWNKTDPLFGDDKAGPANLLTECGSLIAFDERSEGILFRGEPGRDIVASTGSQVSNGDVCGKFLSHEKFVLIEQGELELSILCAPAPADDFSTTKNWSFLGDTHEAPPKPECND